MPWFSQGYFLRIDTATELLILSKSRSYRDRKMKKPQSSFDKYFLEYRSNIYN